MCLITNQLKPIFLDEDIIVYKIMELGEENVIYSAHRQAHYLYGEMYSTTIEEEKDNYTFVDEYDDIKCNREYSMGIYMRDKLKKVIDSREDLITFGQGFHFYKTIDRAMLSGFDSSYTIVKCLIPKGSEVYFNASDLGVTNQIKIVEIVDLSLCMNN